MSKPTIFGLIVFFASMLLGVLFTSQETVKNGINIFFVIGLLCAGFSIGRITGEPAEEK